MAQEEEDQHCRRRRRLGDRRRRERDRRDRPSRRHRPQAVGRRQAQDRGPTPGPQGGEGEEGHPQGSRQGQAQDRRSRRRPLARRSRRQRRRSAAARLGRTGSQDALDCLPRPSRARRDGMAHATASIGTVDYATTIVTGPCAHSSRRRRAGAGRQGRRPRALRPADLGAGRLHRDHPAHVCRAQAVAGDGGEAEIHFSARGRGRAASTARSSSRAPTPSRRSAWPKSPRRTPVTLTLKKQYADPHYARSA